MFHAIPLLLFLFSIFCSLAETGRATTTSVVPDTNHVIILEKNWRLEGNNGISVEARVPGDVLTDLVEGGILDDPYLDRNFLTQPPMNHVTWTYSISLGELQASIENEGAVTWQLVAEGIKMGADIFFNNVHLGTVTDQFLRYTFTLEQKHLGIHSNNVLKIVLDPNIQVNGRFTACSGGWDWAPYSQQMDAQGKQMFTMGIVKPVYLVAIRNYAITHVVPKVYYHGPPHPREPLLHGPQGDFSIRLFIHLEFSNNNLSLVPPQLLVQSKEFGTQVVPVGRPPPNTNTTIIKVFMVAHQNNVELWWPNGMGKQPLYDIYIGVQGVQTNHLMMIRKRIGK